MWPTSDLKDPGRDLVDRAAIWRRHEFDRIMGRIPAGDRAAVTAALGLLTDAGAGEYGVTPLSPVPL